jgi:photosystem II stability/assembly factor-like uncharacterized protein
MDNALDLTDHTVEHDTGMVRGRPGRLRRAAGRLSAGSLSAGVRATVGAIRFGGRARSAVRPSNRSVLWTALIAVLLAGNAGLVLRMLRTWPHAGPTTGPAGLSATTPAPATSPTPAPGPFAPGPSAPADLEPPLDVAADGAALWADVRDCGSTGPASLHRSDDGGRTWRDMPSPASSILRIRVIDAASAWFVGTDSSCQPHLYFTSDGGRSWQIKESTTGAWHRMPDPAAVQLHAPGGLRNVPCPPSARVREVTGESVRDGAVLCGDGTVYRTSDAASSWQLIGTAPGASALEFVTPQVGFIARRDSSCESLRIDGSGDGGHSWSELGCVDVDAGAPVALAFTGQQHGLLTTPEATFATSDGGHSWRQVSGDAVRHPIASDDARLRSLGR